MREGEERKGARDLLLVLSESSRAIGIQLRRLDDRQVELGIDSSYSLRC